MKCIAVIPVRLESMRLPRKALLHESGKYLFQHTWEAAANASKVSRVIVATDSEEISTAAKEFGAEALLTSPKHPSGTDRVREVANQFPEYEGILNIQGDYPELRPEDVNHLVKTLDQESAQSATLGVPIEMEKEIQDPHVVKIACSETGRALYFSRAPIPFPFRNSERPYLRHLGIYGFKRDTLNTFASLNPSPLEQREGLEQLRLLENNISMFVGVSQSPAKGIENRNDYDEFLARLKKS